jgi:hypothetical protein
MVTKFVPLPDNSGGKQRSLAIARRLAERFDLVLCAYDDGVGRPGGLEKLGSTCGPCPGGPGVAVVVAGWPGRGASRPGASGARALAAEVRRAAAEAPLDLLQVEYTRMAPYGDGVGGH